MKSLVSEIVQIVPAQFEPNKFEGFLNELENYSQDSEFEIEAGSAKQFAALVDNIRAKFNKELKDSPELGRRLKVLSTKLHWMTPLALESNLKSELFSQSIVEALKNKIDVLSSIDKWLDFFEYGGEPDMQRRSDAIYLLSTNSEWIGTNKIESSTGSSVPTVQNWIKDFLLSMPRGNQTVSSFDKVNYFTNNQNIKKLTTGEKEILSKIFDIYRYLKNPNEKVLALTREPELVAKPPLPPPPPQTPKPAAPKLEPSPPVTVFNTPAPPMRDVPVNEPKEMTAFEKRLSQISAPVSDHGADLEMLKHRMEDSVPKKSKTAPNSTVDEIKRELKTPELPAHMEKDLPKPVAKPVKPAPMPPAKSAASFVDNKLAEAKMRNPLPPQRPAAPKPVTPPAASMNLKDNLTELRTLEDLKKVEVGHLRRGPVEQQMLILKNKIIEIAKANKMIPYYALVVFEQSPLFKLYLAHGNAMFAGQQTTNGLTQEEFGAIADLRREIQRM